MNLLDITRGLVNVVNPPQLLNVQVSTGNKVDDAGIQIPSYATPGVYVGSIAADVLTITTVTQGKILSGQTLSGATVLTGTTIVAPILINPDGTGTYRINKAQTISSGVLTTELLITGQVQPVGWKDLQQLDGLNLQGTRYAIYFNGRIEGIIRPDNKGGDLVTDPYGRTYLVAMVLEQWGGNTWCKVAATRQNE